QILQWSDYCHQECLLSSSPMPAPRLDRVTETLTISGLPPEYLDLAEKAKASRLPPYQANDCAIDHIPGSVPPRRRIFPLSQPKFEAMKAYIEEELAKGFIRPSASPASAGFFF
ncbi:hypothetical protein M9458_036754, partial [Cirrhinus mrigala]